MKSLHLYRLILGFSACGLCPLAAAEKTEAETQKYSVLLREGREAIGVRSLKATTSPKGIEIIEELEATQRGRKVSWRTTVRYGAGPLAKPEGCEAETSVDGRVSMKGSVSFSESSYKFSGTAHSDRKGNSLPQPAKFGESSQRLPVGTLIFQSALPVLGPRLLQKAGELKGVVFVEFPDDIAPPELIRLKEGCRLVREDAPQGGGFTLKLFDAASKEPLSLLQFDAKGRCSSEASGKLKFARVEDGK